MRKKIFITIAAVFVALSASAQLDDLIDAYADSISKTPIPTDELFGRVPERVSENSDIIMPPALTCDIDSLLNEYYAKQYLRDFECYTSDISEAISDSEYIERLYRLPHTMEMVYNSAVRSVIDRYVGKSRRTLSYLLGKANFYFPIFEEVLEREGLPLELKYLPIIESALRPEATSPAGAGGLWQFMVGTARQYGLKVNSLVDERRDPFKSTVAAAKFLKKLYDIYGDWNLVIAAYNCGPGNVNKAIHRANGSRDYWEIYPYLPLETRGYVPAFIGANYAMNYYCEHKVCPMRTELPMQCDTIMVNRNIKLQQIADVCNMDLKHVKALNPQYRGGIVPGATEPSSICLPLNELMMFIDNEEEIYNKSDEYINRRRVVTPRGRGNGR